MHQHRRLALKRESLAELTTEDLLAVNGALPISLPHPVCALLYPSGAPGCTTGPTGWECGA